MASKFAGVINNLPRMLMTDQGYQDKVDVVKQQMKSSEDFDPAASALARRYRALRGDESSVGFQPSENIELIIQTFGKEGLEAILSAVNMRLEAVTQMMIESFEAEDITQVKNASEGYTVRLQYEPYAQVTDKTAFLKWCQDNGLAGSLSLPWQTTNAITKERLLAGEPEPTGVTAHAKTKVVLSRG